MDIQKFITDITAKLQKDPDLLTNFQKNPIPTVEKLLGVDLPDDQIKAIAEAVKAKINVDDVASTAKNVVGALSGLFGKK